MKIFYSILYAIAMAATIYYNGMNDGRAKMVSMALFAALFALALVKRRKTNNRPKIFNKWMIWFILACVANALLAFDRMGVDSLLNFEIAIPLMVAFSSYYLLDIKRENVSLYMLPVSAFAAFVAIKSVFSGLGGFQVADSYDVVTAKNQVGAAFTSFAILCAVFVQEDKRFIVKSAYGVLSVANLCPAIFFSCRTALLSYVLIVAYMLFLVYRWKSLIVLPLLLLVVMAVGGSDLRNLLYESIVGRRDANDIDNLTSGRLTHATQSLDYFSRHPFFGFYGSGDGYDQMPPNAHVFLLLRLTKWGIIGAIPCMALYFSVFKVFLSSVREKDLLMAGLLSLAFIESFSEYAPPFGPGSCFLVSFVLLGYSLRQQEMKTGLRIMKEDRI